MVFFLAYHHHFGRQCRVADYGFTKLIELFETIPTTIEITEDADGERILQLTDAERLVVVSFLPSTLFFESCIPFIFQNFFIYFFTGWRTNRGFDSEYIFGQTC